MTLSHDALRSLQQENFRLRDQNRELQDKLLSLRRAIEALSRLDQTLEEVNAQSDVIGLIRSILESAMEAVGSSDGSLLLLDEETNELAFVAVIGENAESLSGLRVPASTGIVGSVVASRQARLVEDVRQEPLWSPQVDQAIGFRTSSLLCVPVVHGTRVWGAIEVVNTRSGTPFDKQDLQVLLVVARLAALTLAKAEEATTK